MTLNTTISKMGGKIVFEISLVDGNNIHGKNCYLTIEEINTRSSGTMYKDEYKFEVNDEEPLTSIDYLSSE